MDRFYQFGFYSVAFYVLWALCSWAVYMLCESSDPRVNQPFWIVVFGPIALAFWLILWTVKQYRKWKLRKLLKRMKR
jgi:hypothetical protein